MRSTLLNNDLTASQGGRLLLGILGGPVVGYIIFTIVVVIGLVIQGIFDWIASAIGMPKGSNARLIRVVLGKGECSRCERLKLQRDFNRRAVARCIARRRPTLTPVLLVFRSFRSLWPGEAWPWPSLVP